jgi:hypothetical protein
MVRLSGVVATIRSTLAASIISPYPTMRAAAVPRFSTSRKFIVLVPEPLRQPVFPDQTDLLTQRVRTRSLSVQRATRRHRVRLDWRDVPKGRTEPRAEILCKLLALRFGLLSRNLGLGHDGLLLLLHPSLLVLLCTEFTKAGHDRIFVWLPFTVPRRVAATNRIVRLSTG